MTVSLPARRRPFWHHWPVALRIGALLILVHLLMAAIGPFAAPFGQEQMMAGPPLMPEYKEPENNICSYRRFSTEPLYRPSEIRKPTNDKFRNNIGIIFNPFGFQYCTNTLPHLLCHQFLLT